jgi:hypothetical protein
MYANLHRIQFSNAWLRLISTVNSEQYRIAPGESCLQLEGWSA